MTQRTLFNNPKPELCAICGDVLWIGETGLVCPRGHGPIVGDGYERMKEEFPELRIGYDKNKRERGAAFRGALAGEQIKD